MLRVPPDVDLFDETLREGAERSPLFVDVATKVELARRIVDTGIRTIVVGMYPDVPHNIELTRALLRARLDGELPTDTRFVIITHLGARLRRTRQLVRDLNCDTSALWILGIHSVSDEQLRHLYPMVRNYPAVAPPTDCDPPLADWLGCTDQVRRADSLGWLRSELPVLADTPGIGGALVGLLDAFRADKSHLHDAVEVVRDAGISQIRLVDTAGTCYPRQAGELVSSLVTRNPELKFYGHFHDDFGMATANAMTGLESGLSGADVSVGGIANRAGHPALAEIVMALKHLSTGRASRYRTESLYELSRLTERTYGLIERPAQPITGSITYAVQSGIRTDLLKRSPKIFDEVDPAEIGSEIIKMYGVRSGQDGLLRIIAGNQHEFAAAGVAVAPTTEFADRLHELLEREWSARTAAAASRLRAAIDEHDSALRAAFFDERSVVEWIVATAPALRLPADSAATALAPNND